MPYCQRVGNLTSTSTQRVANRLHAGLSSRTTNAGATSPRGLLRRCVGVHAPCAVFGGDHRTTGRVLVVRPSRPSPRGLLRRCAESMLCARSSVGTTEPQAGFLWYGRPGRLRAVFSDGVQSPCSVRGLRWGPPNHRQGSCGTAVPAVSARSSQTVCRVHAPCAVFGGDYRTTGVGWTEKPRDAVPVKAARGLRLLE